VAIRHTEIKYFHELEEPYPLMGWSGRASAPPAIKAGKGLQKRDVRAMSALALIATEEQISGDVSIALPTGH
jgi:hypothetical protein